MSPRTKQQFEQMRFDRKSAIMDGALHVFSEEGYHSASISKVSKRAGVSKGLLYNYFESKQDLLKALLHTIIDKEIEFTKSLLEKGFYEETFIELIEHTVQLLKEDPKHWKLYFHMAIQPEVLAIIMEDHQADRMLFMEKFMAFFKTKFPDNPVGMMHYFNATFSGIKMNFVLDPENFPIDEVKTLLINQFIKK